MDWVFNKMDYKWIGLEQKWIGSRKLDFLPTPTAPYETKLSLVYHSLRLTHHQITTTHILL